MKSISQFFLLIFPVVFICVELQGSLTWAQIKPTPLPSTRPDSGVIPNKRRIVMPPPPTSEPPPGGRIRGGATRSGGECQAVDTDLTALVPFTVPEASVVNVWGLTTLEHPTFWVYVPYTQSSGYPAEFILQDDDSNPIYTRAIALPQQPGVIGIQLTDAAPKLTVGKRYRWFFNIHCNSPQNPVLYVEGVIQRVNLSLGVAQQLQSAQPKTRAAIYAENGIWHEAISTLAQLRQQNSQDAALQTDWKNLLEAIGLSEIAAKPLVK